MTFELKVKTLSGKEFVVTLEQGAKVIDVKKEVEKASEITSCSQRLIFAGVELEDEISLADYNITPHSTLHLVLKMRG